MMMNQKQPGDNEDSAALSDQRQKGPPAKKMLRRKKPKDMPKRKCFYFDAARTKLASDAEYVTPTLDFFPGWHE